MSRTSYILLCVTGAAILVMNVTLAVALVRRHNNAIEKLAKLRQEHKPPDPELAAILKADSAYMMHYK